MPSKTVNVGTTKNQIWVTINYSDEYDLKRQIEAIKKDIAIDQLE